MGKANKKLEGLKAIISEMESVVVAFSGGVDSTFLLKVAYDCLGEKALAVTARSPSYPEREFRAAEILARKIGSEHIVVQSEELNNENFTKNPPRRCYYCKKELFTILDKVARKKNLKWVADATSQSDESDYRPGREAGKELGVRSPLLEAKFDKDDIRYFSKELGLPNWDKPAYACLASRFPYGEEITGEKLEQVGLAEEFLKELGFRQLRLRHHDTLARIELEPEDIALLLEKDKRRKIVEYLKSLGYKYVALDLQGYRRGSMNETLE